MPVSVPDFETQKKIVGLLDAIEGKIENNKEINDNLLQQAETLFKDRFLNNDSLPDGWKIQTLGDVSDMTAGGDKPKTISDSKTDDCKYPIYSNGISDEGLYGFTNDYKISEESVTVSARGTIGYVCLRHIPFTPIVRLVTLIPHKNIISAKYLYLWLKSIPIHGTGTTQQQLTVPDFRKTEIIIPSEEAMSQFTETIDPLFQQIWANQEQNTNLANLRDALLPKLMSGELDVSEIDI
ncbi:MAG: restriction endonuclease subunit S [Butyrivibrio sp.]|nr:restriction endonuclease subunit S [Butyrivibrio sp.]